MTHFKKQNSLDDDALYENKIDWTMTHFKKQNSLDDDAL